MSRAISYKFKLSEDKLTELIERYRNKLSYGILEGITEIHIDLTDNLTEQLKRLEDFHKGRLFGPTLELRWRRSSGGHFRCLVITDEDDDAKGIELEEVREVEYLLWGEKRKELWEEARIPRLLKYPIGGKRGKIKVIEYEEKGKQGRLYRFASLS